MRLKNVEDNVRRFARDDWECVGAVYATAAEVPSERLAALAEVCHVYRAPRRRWGSFLLALTPAMVQHFDKVAILLDDLVLPRETPVASILREMDAHGVDVYSPAIHGGVRNFASTRTADKQRCLMSTHGIEVFFSIYSRRLGVLLRAPPQRCERRWLRLRHLLPSGVPPSHSGRGSSDHRRARKSSGQERGGRLEPLCLAEAC